MKFFTTSVFLFFIISVAAQKRLISIPFEFEKRLLAASDYDAYFLDDKADATFSLVLKDNKKVEYLQLDKNFKIKSDIHKEIKSTVFDDDITDYRGGTAENGLFHFIYEEKEKKAFSRPVTVFLQETIDYNTGTISTDKLFEIPKAEKVLSSFSDYNAYYTITADDKKKELVFYVVNHAGNFSEHRLTFNIPDEAGKKRDKLSEYFTELKVIKTSEEPDFSSAVSSAKLFSDRNQFTFVVNENDHPVHLFRVQLPDFKTAENFIDMSSFKNDAKDKIFVNSFLRDQQLFSLIIDKKSIRIVTQNVNTGAVLGKQEINEESSLSMFAATPMKESRRGKKEDEKNVDDIKKLLKALDKGTEGVMVMQNAKGQLVIIAGTYDLIKISSGGSSAGSYVGGYQQGSIAVDPHFNQGATRSATGVYNPYLYYRPGTPSYTTANARYYTTTYFKLLTDPTGSKIEKGKIPITIAEQIKTYLEGIDGKATATNQFSLNDKEYYGYYDRDSKSYVVEEIRIRK